MLVYQKLIKCDKAYKARSVGGQAGSKLFVGHLKTQKNRGKRNQISM